MRAVQITRFGGPEVLDVVDLPDPEPTDGQQVFDVSTAGINDADTLHSLPQDMPERRTPRPPAGRRTRPDGCGGTPTSTAIPPVTRLALRDQSSKSVLTLSSSHSSASARAVPSTRR